MNPHVAMTAFVEVARAGGFSAAARRLNVSTTAISRHVAELERMLGVTLLRRTTRHVSLTEAGADYLPRAAAILEEINASWSPHRYMEKNQIALRSGIYNKKILSNNILQAFREGICVESE